MITPAVESAYEEIKPEEYEGVIREKTKELDAVKADQVKTQHKIDKLADRVCLSSC